jgi:hypothetical protein
MNLRRRSGRIVLISATLIAIVLFPRTANAQGQAYRVLYKFGHSFSDGWFPVGVPAVAKNGDLYGVTNAGGTTIYGTVFKLTAPQTRGGEWKKTVLYDFPGGKGGEHPVLLVLGPDGNLYGILDTLHFSAVIALRAVGNWNSLLLPGASWRSRLELIAGYSLCRLAGWPSEPPA